MVALWGRYTFSNTATLLSPFLPLNQVLYKTSTNEDSDRLDFNHDHDNNETLIQWPEQQQLDSCKLDNNWTIGSRIIGLIAVLDCFAIKLSDYWQLNHAMGPESSQHNTFSPTSQITIVDWRTKGCLWFYWRRLYRHPPIRESLIFPAYLCLHLWRP